MLIGLRKNSAEENPLPRAFSQDQEAIFKFLADPATHAGVSVTRIDTHGASVFLAGPNVYKVKRAVRYPYLDFSTLEKRHATCVAEMAVNRDNAPQLYLGVVPITLRDGMLALGGDGKVVEYAVHMNRFDEGATLDRLAAKGPLERAMMASLAEAILKSHRAAPAGKLIDPTAALGAIIQETMEGLEGVPCLMGSSVLASLTTNMAKAFTDAVPLLRRRAKDGQVRRCHGDLHLGNIVRIAGKPILFDAIEFDDAIATCDVLYDLAFVLMDLWERGLRADANYLFNRYLAGLPANELPVHLAGLAALPLFMSLRAAIRAKVLIAQAANAGDKEPLEARACVYVQTAESFLRPRPTRLVAIGGLSGSGKTALSSALAPLLGRPPGAVHIRSDIERKHLFGKPEREVLPPAAYTSAVSATVQTRLLSLTKQALAVGQSVVLDATHRTEEERQAVEELARNLDLPFLGLWLEAPGALLARRVAARHGDASDATPAVVAAQLAGYKGNGANNWDKLDASRGKSEVFEAAAALAGLLEG